MMLTQKAADISIFCTVWMKPGDFKTLVCNCSQNALITNGENSWFSHQTPPFLSLSHYPQNCSGQRHSRNISFLSFFILYMLSIYPHVLPSSLLPTSTPRLDGHLSPGLLPSPSDCFSCFHAFFFLPTIHFPHNDSKWLFKSIISGWLSIEHTIEPITSLWFPRLQS